MVSTNMKICEIWQHCYVLILKYC